MDQPNTTEGRRYHVLEALGKGGFGTVYRAELQSTGGFRKPVALKVLNPDVEGMDEIVGRLRDEARMLGVLRHRAIVQVDGLVFLDGRWTVVMEYVEGASLNHLVERYGKLPPKVAVAICQEVAGALDTAYARPTRGGEAMGLLHRDIKPANIQLTPLGEVKLLDFGVARANMEKREAKTQAVIYGSLPYMSPERYELTDKHQSDIYALGATLLEIITGEQMGRANLHPDRFQTQVEAELDKVRAIIDHEALIAFLRRTLAYEWAERPDARQFERECRDLAASLDGPWLKDWSDDQVTALVDERHLENDELSGKLLTEATSGAHALASLPEEADATDESLWMGADSGSERPPPPPPQPSPEPAPQPPTSLPKHLQTIDPSRPHMSEPVKRRKSGAARQRSGLASVLRYVAITLLVLILLGLIAVVVLPFLGMGGLALLCAPFWGDAMIETHQESFAEMEAMLVADCAPSPERDHVVQLMQAGVADAEAGTIGLWEMASFEVVIDDAVVDGIIDKTEARQIEARYRGMVDD